MHQKLTTSKSLSRIPITELKGVGPAVAEKLKKIKILSVQDALFHLPIRYEDKTTITPIGHLRPSENKLIQGFVVSADVVHGKRRMLKVKIQDNTGILVAHFFYFGGPLKTALRPGVELRAWGETRRGNHGLVMFHPELEILEDDKPFSPLADQLTSVYSTTEGLQQARIRKVINAAIGYLAKGEVDELIPQQLLNQVGQTSLNDALMTIHRPPVGVSLAALSDGSHLAQQRLALEELVAHHLSLLQLRSKIQQDKAKPLNASGSMEEAFLNNLPYSLTTAQQRVGREIKQDLKTVVPMLRLVQGDVGAGKTVVAALAAIQAVELGYQVALMAPTEILAEQHYLGFKEWFEPLDIKIGWLVGKQTVKQRRLSLEAIASGESQIIVGTHALFQESVVYHNLALTIIDEQHRFGVDQRLALRDKLKGENAAPHQLIMTATPIPRTLAMTQHADLDCSVIDELPPGRTPINTVAIDSGRRHDVIGRVSATINEGRQAYWVCTLIDESEELEAEAAEETFNNLKDCLPNIQIGLVHGRMKASEKATVMSAFKNNEFQLLVATTVIEVGVDVPNATVMIIENPERLGLAQLHQLRGRVGRGQYASFCVLLYGSPLSVNGRERLNVLRESTDGFVIAEKDLEIRGAGEMLGRRQTGDVGFKIADLYRDAHLLDSVKILAVSLQQEHPKLVDPLIERWLAGADQFANA